jgi:hypothetical protein
MNPPSETGSSGSDSDSGFEFKGNVTGPSSLPTFAPKLQSAAGKQPSAKKQPTQSQSGRRPEERQLKSEPKKQPLNQPPNPPQKPANSIPSPRRVTNSLASVPIIETSDEPVTRTVVDRIHRNRSQLSSVVTSIIAHTILFLFLALWITDRQQDSSIGLLARFAMPTIDVEPAIEPSPLKFETADAAESPVESLADATDDAIEETAANDVPAMTDSVVEAESVDDVTPTESGPVKTMPLGGGLQGRDAESRARLAAKYGGSAGSEEAVERGLRWIINHQLSDGSWRFRHHQGQCAGRCGDEGKIDMPTAATGLALMSLMGAGYTHEKGPYQEQIRKGLDYLNGQSKFRGSLRGHGTLYAHAIATIALAEAVTLTGDETYRQAVNDAYEYIALSQHKKGGWKYEPQTPGDMSVTGWQLMAVKACRNAGCSEKSEMMIKAKSFVDSLAHADDAAYGYEIDPKGDVKIDTRRKPSCTAIGHLMQMYLGSPLESPELLSGCELLASAGPSDTDVYFNYYGTLVLHHARSRHWKRWNQTVREHLIRTQQRNGHEDGSWFFPDLHGNVGGRLYTTAMAVMTLEVYYRFMPLYEFEQSGEVRGDVSR